MAKQKKVAVAVKIEAPLPTKKRRGTPLAKEAGERLAKWAFKKGQSGNPSGRPKDENRLFSKALRARLSHPAPLEVCEAVGLGRNTTWAEILALSTIKRAVRGDSACLNAIIAVTEPNTSRRGELDLMDLDGEPIGAAPELHVHLVAPRIGGGSDNLPTIEALPR
ncbi:DUF5681 domain-containing protein [Granulicella sp. S190]|uniref:DUF5681 domain-containing protein n=1 Tax=Granulicella sp. S190 TaxID=1747226 RepID=UPI00352BA453